VELVVMHGHLRKLPKGNFGRRGVLFSTE